LSVLNRSNIIASNSSAIIAKRDFAPSPLLSTEEVEATSLAITELSNTIMVGLRVYDIYSGGPNAAEIFAFGFNGSSITTKSLAPSATGKRLTYSTPAMYTIIYAMASIPGTDNVAFTYNVDMDPGVGLINYANLNPTTTGITVRNAVQATGLPRIGNNIDVAPNGSELAVSAFQVNVGGPIPPAYRLGLNTIGGVTSFATTEEFFIPNVTVPPTSSGGEVVLAYDALSRLYGYVVSHDHYFYNSLNERYFQFRAPWLGSGSMCFTPQDKEEGGNLTQSTWNINILSFPNPSLSSFSSGTLTQVAFSRVCQNGCGAEPSSSSLEYMPVTLQFCEKPGINGVWFNFCNFLSSNGYTMPANYLITLTDLADPQRFEPYSSDQYILDNPLGDPCFSHHLQEGAFEFRIYNKSTCTYARLYVYVVKTVDEEHDVRIEVPCPTETRTIDISTYPDLNQCTGVTSGTPIGVSMNGSPVSNSIYNWPNLTLTKHNLYQIVYYKSYGCNCIYNIRVVCPWEPRGTSDPDSTVSVSQAPEISNTRISIFPNPSTGIFNITCTNPKGGRYDVIIYNLIGKVIYSRTGLDADSVGLIDLSAFANGIYTAKINMGAQWQYFKLIKD
jgi:hypothetical protein